MAFFRKSFLSLLMISMSMQSLCAASQGLWQTISSNTSNVVRWFNERPVAKYAALGALGSVLVAGSIYSWNGWTSRRNATDNAIQAVKKQNEEKQDATLDGKQSNREAPQAIELSVRGVRGEGHSLKKDLKDEKESCDRSLKDLKDEKEKSEGSFAEFDTWFHACRKMPFNVRSQGSPDYQTPLTWQSFKAVLDEFFVCSQQKDCMHDSTAWLGDAKSNNEKLVKLHGSQGPLVAPFVQKVTLPAESVVAFHGDFHGDIHSMMLYLKELQRSGYLDGFKICNEKFYMTFLGDYVDRGRYGSEVLYTIMRLKIANPDRVFLVRGNHEDVTVAIRYGFFEEFDKKFPSNDTKKFNYLSHMYDFLPSALYLGSGNDYLQCCHGGMEMGFDPKPLLASNKKVAFEWLGSLQELSGKAREQHEKIASENPEADGLKEATAIKTSYEVKDGFHGYGFMWNDFIVDQSAKIIQEYQRRGLQYPRNRTKQLLTLGSQATARVRGVFRAHQHEKTLANPMMASILERSDHQGVSKLWKPDNIHNQNLWDGIVCTFCVAPDTTYSDEGRLYNYDTYGILTMDGSFDSWKLDVRRNKIIS